MVAAWKKLRANWSPGRVTGRGNMVHHTYRTLSNQLPDGA
jgi:hypothetical protein